MVSLFTPSTAQGYGGLVPRGGRVAVACRGVLADIMAEADWLKLYGGSWI